MRPSPDHVVPAFPDEIDFGREICGDLRAAESREWLTTNGIGGYAFGTVAGLQTRCYHGLLVAALQPPLGRTILVAKLDETARYASQEFALFTNRWADGTVAPEGYRNIERFHLEGTTPVWTFALADALLEKRIFMASGANTTYVVYRLARARSTMELSIRVLVDYAGEHCVTMGETRPMQVAPAEHGLKVAAFEGSIPFYILSDSATASPAQEWYRNFDLAAERARGLPDRADHFFAGEFRATIAPGESLTMVASTAAAPALIGEAALAKRQSESRALLDRFFAVNTGPGTAAPPPAVRQLVLAADQFLVARPLDGAADTKTILAGYPWFSDWGRDAMIALPGLCLATGRPWMARNILRTFSRFVSEGMLPNQFPRAGAAPIYNSVDAALWYFEAVRQYFEATSDVGLLHELYPVLEGIIDAHVHGTYFVVAHFHYIMVGGAVMGYLGGIHFWWPKITGRLYPDGWARLAAAIIFIGFNLTFFPQYMLGYLGMPRRYAIYPPKFQVLNVMSSAGASILAVGYAIPLVYLIWSMRYGPVAGPNPWGAKGLEWETPSPPPTENFEETPVVTEEAYAYGAKEVSVG